MVSAEYTDGRIVRIKADAWTVSGPVVSFGAVSIPIQHLRLWEVIKVDNSPESVNIDEVDNEHV